MMGAAPCSRWHAPTDPRASPAGTRPKANSPTSPTSVPSPILPAGAPPTCVPAPGITCVAANCLGLSLIQCGVCYALTYKDKTIHILGIDHGNSYIISLAAMNDLTSNQATFLGRVDATVTSVDKALCGL
jgi:hypothetical protein